MTDERDENGKLLPDAKRLTNVGKFVRSTSIDELTVNQCVKGRYGTDRPSSVVCALFAILYEEEQRRHEVRPGISGWAQCQAVSPSPDAETPIRCEYVDKCSLGMDLKIIFTTIKQVLAREDVVWQLVALMTLTTIASANGQHKDART